MRTINFARRRSRYPAWLDVGAFHPSLFERATRYNSFKIPSNKSSIHSSHFECRHRQDQNSVQGPHEDQQALRLKRIQLMHHVDQNYYYLLIIPTSLVKYLEAFLFCAEKLKDNYVPRCGTARPTTLLD